MATMESDRFFRFNFVAPNQGKYMILLQVWSFIEQKY